MSPTAHISRTLTSAALLRDSVF